jgi:hypothetical protein
MLLFTMIVNLRLVILFSNFLVAAVADRNLVVIIALPDLPFRSFRAFLRYETDLSIVVFILILTATADVQMRRCARIPTGVVDTAHDLHGGITPH